MLSARIALLLVVAVALGFAAARVAPARFANVPTPTPAPSITAETPTPVPTDDDRVWRQPLSAGCATAGGEAYFISLGGGIVRFDGARWSLVDETLRQLRAIVCVHGAVLAVGDGGRYVRIDELERTIRSEVLTQADLYALTALDARMAWAGGADLTLMRLGDDGWTEAGRGGGAAWRAVLARSGSEVWLAGDAGQLWLFDGRRFVDRSLQRGPDLTSLAPLGAETLVGASDGSVYAVTPSQPARLVGTTSGGVRGMAVASSGVAVLADDLRIVDSSGIGAPLAHGLTCIAVAAFGSTRGDLWVIGRQGSSAGVARFDGRTWTKTGRC